LAVLVNIGETVGDNPSLAHIDQIVTAALAAPAAALPLCAA